MAAEAAAAAGGADPVSAIANALGSYFDVIKTGIGGGLAILKGRDDSYRENNQIRFGYDQMDHATNAQRLQFLQSSRSEGSKSLMIISGMLAVIVIAFALLHKRAN